MYSAVFGDVNIMLSEMVKSSLCRQLDYKKLIFDNSPQG